MSDSSDNGDISEASDTLPNPPPLSSSKSIRMSVSPMHRSQQESGQGQGSTSSAITRAQSIRQSSNNASVTSSYNSISNSSISLGNQANPYRREIEGKVWKRAPRTGDKDSSQLKRMMSEMMRSSSNTWKIRYARLNPMTKEMVYFSDKAMKNKKGTIDLTFLVEVHKGKMDGNWDGSPTEHEFHLVTKNRVWSFCVDTPESLTTWIGCSKECIKSNRRSIAITNTKNKEQVETNKKVNITNSINRTSNVIPPLSPKTNDNTKTKDEGEKEEDGHKSDHELHRGESTTSIMKSKQDPSSEYVPILCNPKRQTEILAKLKEPHMSYEYVSGNVPNTASSLFSSNGFNDLEWYSVLKQIYPSSSGEKNSPDTSSGVNLDAKIEKAINASRILWYNEGYTLTKEGTPSQNNIYIVLSGELTRWKKCGEKGKRELIGKLSRGQWTGDVEILYDLNWLSTVKVGRSVALLVMSKSIYLELLGGPSTEFYQAAAKIASQYILAESFASFHKFRNFTLSQIEVMSTLFQIECYPAGTDLISQGDTADRFCILLQGICKSSFSCNGKIVRLPLNYLGDWFGGLELLQKEKYRCSTNAKTDVVLAIAKGDAFEKFYKLSQKIFEDELSISRKQFISLIINQVPLFVDTKAQHKDLTNIFSFVEYESGTVVCQQGEVQEDVHIIVTGKADVKMDAIGNCLMKTESIGDPLKLADMREFDVIGEMSLLNYGSIETGVSSAKKPTAGATVITNTPCTMLKAKIGHIWRVFLKNSRLRARLIHIRNKRIAEFLSTQRVVTRVLNVLGCRHPASRPIVDDIMKELKFDDEEETGTEKEAKGNIESKKKVDDKGTD